MLTIFLVQWQKLRRFPYIVILMLGLNLGFIFAFGFTSSNKTSINTFADPSLKPQQRDTWLAKLNRSDRFTFKLMDETTARNAVTEGRVDLAVKLMESNYLIVAGVDSPYRYELDYHLSTFYVEELRLRAAEQQLSGKQFRDDVEQILASPTLKVVASNSQGEAESFRSSHSLQLLFGMTLFFVINTITFSTSAVLEEKRVRTWDRLILSPVRKWEMYTGHLLYSFLVGCVQILLIFLLFYFAFGVNLGASFGTILIITACYSFAIAALGVLMAALVKTIEQFYTLAPSVASIIAMLGGAYWPLETITNPFLLALSKMVPLTYGMEALKGTVIFHQGLLELATPLSILLLFGVLCMGVGINLMERRST